MKRKPILHQKRVSAHTRAVRRLISLIRTKHGAMACCYRTLPVKSLRDWAYGLAERPKL